MMFYVGQKVVFVGYPGPSGIKVGPAKAVPRAPYCEVGRVYTVLGVEQRALYATSKWAGVSLYLGFHQEPYGPVWHHHTGFRPLIERPTDISVFERLLTPSKQTEDA